MTWVADMDGTFTGFRTRRHCFTHMCNFTCVFWENHVLPQNLLLEIKDFVNTSLSTLPDIKYAK